MRSLIGRACAPLIQRRLRQHHLPPPRQVDTVLISPTSCRRRLSLLCELISEHVLSSEDTRPLTRLLFLRSVSGTLKILRLISPVVQDKTGPATKVPVTSQTPHRGHLPLDVWVSPLLCLILA
jgi:hypothetical protein